MNVCCQVREYGAGSCRTRHVLLKPTAQSLWADVELLSRREWGERERLELESQLTAHTNPVLCLDPNPRVALAGRLARGEHWPAPRYTRDHREHSGPPGPVRARRRAPRMLLPAPSAPAPVTVHPPVAPVNTAKFRYHI